MQTTGIITHASSQLLRFLSIKTGHLFANFDTNNLRVREMEFMCESSNKRIGCINMVNTINTVFSTQKKSQNRELKQKKSSSALLWFNIFKWLTLSAYELELEFECECRQQLRGSYHQFFHGIQFYCLDTLLFLTNIFFRRRCFATVIVVVVIVLLSLAFLYFT